MIICILVDSNDKLYGGDYKFLNEIQNLCVTLLDEIMVILNSLNAVEVSIVEKYECTFSVQHCHIKYNCKNRDLQNRSTKL